MEKKILILLGILLCLGLYLRISGTLNGFFAFTFDQGRDFLTWKELVYHHDIRLLGPPTGIEGVFHGVWWHWILAPVFWLVHGDPMWMVATFNFVSTGAIILAFIVGKILKNNILGVFLAILVAVSPHYIGTAAQLWHPNVIPLLLLFFLICLWKYLKKQWSFVWLAAVLGLLFEFEFASGGLLILPVLVSLFVVKRLPTLKEIVLGFLAFLFWLTPGILFELRHNFLQARSLIAFVQAPQTGAPETTLFFRFHDRLLGFLSTINSAFTGDYTLLAIVLVALGGGLLLRRYHNRSKDEQVFIKSIGILLGLFFIETVLYPNTLWNYYLVSVPTLLLPFVGYSFWSLWKYKKNVGMVFVIILVLINLKPWRLGKSEWEGDASTYKNQLRIVDTIYKDVGDEMFNVSVYSPSVIDYTYQYLFEWQGEKRHVKAPDRQDEHQVIYFIVEPDPWNKGLREIWLRERQGDGTIVWQKTFTGGIDVEKRVR